MPNVSVKQFQRRIAELDAQYPIAQPKRTRSFKGALVLIFVALMVGAVFASFHRSHSDDFVRLTLKQSPTQKPQISDAEAQAKWNAIWGAATTDVRNGE